MIGLHLGFTSQQISEAFLGCFLVPNCFICVDDIFAALTPTVENCSGSVQPRDVSMWVLRV